MEWTWTTRYIIILRKNICSFIWACFKMFYRFDTILGPNWNSTTNSDLGQDKTMKRDIACFPTSTPMSMSPAIMHRSESDKTRPESAEDLKQYGSSKNQKLPPLNPVGIVKVTTESDESFYKLPDIRKDSFPE